MLKVEDYGRIRRAHRDGMSIREIAQHVWAFATKDPRGARGGGAAALHALAAATTAGADRGASAMDRRDSCRGRTGAAQATSYGDATLPAVARRRAVRRRLRPSAAVRGRDAGPRARNVSPFVVRARPTGRERLRSDLGRLPGRQSPGSDPARDVGVLERHLYDRAAKREDRGDLCTARWQPWRFFVACPRSCGGITQKPSRPRSCVADNGS